MLIQVNPATGAHVPNAFGPGLDYVPIYTNVSGVDLYDVDDIAVDPTDGQMYAVANNNGGNDRLIRVNKLTGAVTNVGRLRLSNGTFVTDMEGFSFSNDGTFYGTTGANSSILSQRNSLWTIDPATGISTQKGTFSIGGDYEGVSCLTEGSNLMTGLVFDDVDGSGDWQSGEPGEPGVTVRLYLDNNQDGQVDPGDTQIDSTTTANDGTYEFEVGITGAFVIDVDTTTLPAGSALTTDNVETAVFTGFFLTDADNDFGFRATANLSIVKTASADPAIVGNNLIYTLTVTNGGPGEALNVVVTDALPSGVTHVSTDTNGQGTCSNPAGVVCELGTINSGQSATVTIEVTVN